MKSLEDSATSWETLRRHRFIVIVRQRWWFPFLTVVAAIGITVYFAHRAPPLFVSTARMGAEGKLQMNVGWYQEQMPNYLGTQIRMLQSELILNRAHATVAARHPDLAALAPATQGTNKDFTPLKLVATQENKTALVNLQAIWTNAAYTQAFLDALMEEFLNYKRELKARTSTGTLTSITQELLQQEKELQKEQEKLNVFQQENNWVALQAENTSDSAYLARLRTELADLKMEYQFLDIVLNDPSFKSSEDLLTSTDLTQGNAPAKAALTPTKEFLAAVQHVNQLKVQRQRLGKNLRPKHPKLVKLDQTISEEEKLIEMSHMGNRSQLLANLQSLNTKKQGMEEAIKEWEGKVQSSNRRLAEFQRLQSNVQRVQSLYDRLLGLVQSVDVYKSLDNGDVFIVEPASTPLLASQRILFKAFFAVLAGAIASFLTLFLIERTDDRITSLTELAEHFEFPVVGQVPETKALDDPASRLLKADDDRYMFVEGFRNIRSSLLFMPCGETRPKTLIVTSAVPNEGKSTVSANLAQILALGGYRVLLIDADLRCGGLHRFFGLPEGPGLTELLSDKAHLEQVLLPTTQPNLCVIPKGKGTRDFGEMFLGPRVKVLLEQVANDYDFILFDTVPILAADDTSSLAPNIDGVLFVVRDSFTRFRLARQALSMLQQRQANILGLIFNRANTTTRDYYYHKYSKYYGPKHAANA